MERDAPGCWPFAGTQEAQRPHRSGRARGCERCLESWNADVICTVLHRLTFPSRMRRWGRLGTRLSGVLFRSPYLSPSLHLHLLRGPVNAGSIASLPMPRSRHRLGDTPLSSPPVYTARPGRTEGGIRPMAARPSMPFMPPYGRCLEVDNRQTSSGCAGSGEVRTHIHVGQTKLGGW